MASRAVLYIAGAVAGVGLGLVITKSVSWVHPISLAAVYVATALEHALGK